MIQSVSCSTVSDARIPFVCFFSPARFFRKGMLPSGLFSLAEPLAVTNVSVLSRRSSRRTDQCRSRSCASFTVRCIASSKRSTTWWDGHAASLLVSTRTSFIHSAAGRIGLTIASLVRVGLSGMQSVLLHVDSWVQKGYRQTPGTPPSPVVCGSVPRCLNRIH